MTSEAIINWIQARLACAEDAKKNGYRKGKGGKGVVECPIYHGQLAYLVASYNDHIWGQCQTKGCVAWME